MPMVLGALGHPPCAMMEPPVMLCVISLRPGFKFNIFAGVVYLL